jgi:hypothetical protein
MATLLGIKRHIGLDTIIVSDINVTLLSIVKSTRQKISINFRVKLHCRSNGLAEIYRIFHPTVAEYIFFLADQIDL